MRVGIGYDIHALKKGRRLVLGGVHIPFPKGLVGHSDGDALYHAILDAALGAAGAGDIGDYFPDRDPAHKNADSALFVKKIKALLDRRKFVIRHIDSVILAEAPKLVDFKSRMKKNISRAFGVSPDSVSVKAKTHEGFGEIGRGRAIACYAVVSLKARD
ncbi:MAG: 2-C-methyl-D-erythritol 2,4-cyclodiphosphate synthase [Candidatus Omnitrophica bacterium]|nr:2-C-methyl-D-erythritol 2,4-cyclodiphosphate synthase [Candidatus Omnitrophota bacterium]